MQEPKGRPYDMTPVDYYTKIAPKRGEVRELTTEEKTYVKWFIDTQIPAFQGNRERRKNESHPRPGDISRVDGMNTAAFVYDGNFWQMITWEEELRHI